MIMGQFIEYNGCVGSIEYSLDDDIYYGKLLNIRDLVAYEGNTFELLYEDYLDAVDDYIELKKEVNKV